MLPRGREETGEGGGVAPFSLKIQLPRPDSMWLRTKQRGRRASLGAEATEA